MVHLFFWDYTLDHAMPPVTSDPERVAQEYEITVDEAKQLIEDNPDQFANEFQREMRGYKLLFSGEVIGVTLMKTPSGRQAVLQCSDFSTYWDTTYQFFVSYSPNGNFLGTSAAVWAGSDSMFDDLTAGHTSVMNEYLRSKPKTPGLTNVKGLMGGIISLLEAMGGVPKHTHGINDFFTIAELKNHILQQIVAEQNDDTAQRLFDDKAFASWLSGGMSSLGQLATFRDMMKLLFKYVYYEVIPNPAAMYVPSKKGKTTKKTFKTTTSLKIPPTLQGDIVSVRNGCETWGFGILWSDVDNMDEDKYAKSYKDVLKKTADSSDMPKYFKTRLEQTYPWFDKIKSTEKEPRTAGPLDMPESATFRGNRAAWKRITAMLYEILGKDNTRFSGTGTKINRTPSELDRLHTQIFRPDCFFAAAPRCNVLFPDQYTQFQYSRNFLQETTRLRLSVDWLFGASSGGLLAEYHFAPATKDIQKMAKMQGNSGIRALLPWEIYSGILPKFETIHEMNYVAGRNERKMGIKGNIKGAAKNYAQRTANFNYMKYRFASRTCEVSAKFNPFMVCGFPAVIIDRPFIIDPFNAEDVRETVKSEQNSKDAKAKVSQRRVSSMRKKEPESVLPWNRLARQFGPKSDAQKRGNYVPARFGSGKPSRNANYDDMGEFVREAAKRLHAPTQYLGMVAALSHSVSQEGASTSAVLTHARTHRITDDDFLNIFSEEVAQEAEKSIVSTPLNTEELMKKGDFRLLKYVIDATPQDLHKQAQTAAESDVDDGDFSLEIEERPTGSPDLSRAQESDFGTLLAVPPEKPAKVQLESSRTVIGESGIPITGKVKTDRLQGTRQVILVPDPGGKLGIGSKGPKGGKIVQIQCVTDAALCVIGKDARKKLNTRQAVTLSSDTVDEFVRDEETGKLRLKTNVVNTSQVTYLWKHIVIHEEVSTFKKVNKLLPVEEGIRPPWFSPLYSNWFIGKHIYEPFIGCGSIVDQALFLTDQGAASFGTGRNQQQELLGKLEAAGNDRQEVMKLLEEAKAKRISDVPDIESSVDVLAYIYGEVRRLNLDVHRFVHDYTRRPIATMEEILGSEDLEYKVLPNDKLELVKGTPGFHSTAIADVGGRLRGLIDNPDMELSRLKVGGKKSPVSRILDPRPGRRMMVIEYLKEINASSGSLGVGVQG